MGGNGDFLGLEFGLGLLQGGLEFGLLALQGAFAAADFGDQFLQFAQRGSQFRDLILAPENRGGRFAVAVAIEIAAGVNAVRAEQVAAQRHIMESAVSVAPRRGRSIEVLYNARLSE